MSSLHHSRPFTTAEGDDACLVTELHELKLKLLDVSTNKLLTSSTHTHIYIYIYMLCVFGWVFLTLKGERVSSYVHLSPIDTFCVVEVRERRSLKRVTRNQSQMEGERSYNTI